MSRFGEFAPLAEATLEKRGEARTGSKALRLLKRMPNGKFAPKGSGEVLKRGDHVHVPGEGHGRVSGAGVVTLDSGKSIQLDASAVAKGASPEPEAGTPEAKAAQERTAKRNTERYGKPDAHESPQLGSSLHSALKKATAKEPPKSPGGQATQELGAAKSALKDAESEYLSSLMGDGDPAAAEKKFKAARERVMKAEDQAQKVIKGMASSAAKSYLKRGGDSLLPPKADPDAQHRTKHEATLDAMKVGDDKDVLGHKVRRTMIGYYRNEPGLPFLGQNPRDAVDALVGTSGNVPASPGAGKATSAKAQKAEDLQRRIRDAESEGKPYIVQRLKQELARVGAAPQAPRPKPDAKEPPASPGTSKVGPVPGTDIKDSPGRGPTGKLRNFKAMSDSKLKDTHSALTQHGGDPEAHKVVTAEAKARGLGVPSAPEPASAGGAKAADAKPKRNADERAALKKNFESMGRSPLTEMIKELESAGDDPEALALAKGALDGKASKPKPGVAYGAGGDPTKPYTKGKRVSELKPGTPFKHKGEVYVHDKVDEDGFTHAHNNDTGEETQLGDVRVEPVDLKKDASAKGKGDPQQAALDAYKQAGGDDPAVIAALGGAAQPKVSAPEQAAGVEGAGGMVANTQNLSLKDLPLGSQFRAANGEDYTLHKFVGDPWVIAKPIDGGKAKPFHKMMPPTHVQAGPGSPTPDKAGAKKADEGDDLYEKLAASVDLAQKGKLKK